MASRSNAHVGSGEAKTILISILKNLFTCINADEQILFVIDSSEKK